PPVSTRFGASCRSSPALMLYPRQGVGTGAGLNRMAGVDFDEYHGRCRCPASALHRTNQENVGVGPRTAATRSLFWRFVMTRLTTLAAAASLTLGGLVFVGCQGEDYNRDNSGNAQTSGDVYTRTSSSDSSSYNGSASNNDNR